MTKKSNRECPQEVLGLLEHLKSTGTGEFKLAAIKQLACTCESSDEFLIRLSEVVTPVTINKINAYIASQQPPVADASVDEIEIVPATEEVVKSPVAEMKADEAIEFIKSLDAVGNTQALELIVLSDSRVTVQRAAQEKLDTLTANT